MRHESNGRAKLVANFVFVDVLHRLVCNDVVMEHIQVVGLGGIRASPTVA